MPLIDQDTFERLQQAMKRPDTRKVKPRRGARRYLLSGIVYRAVCQRPMFGNRGGVVQGEVRFCYTCQGAPGTRHSVGISGHGLDDFMEKAVLNELVVTRLATRPVAAFAGDERLGFVKDRIVELMNAFSAGQLSGAVVVPQVQMLEQEREQLEEQRALFIRATSGPVISAITPEAWADTHTDKRRAVVETLIETVLIRPAVKHQNKFDYDRIEVVWRS